ncbi:hypothetical protein EJ05DRAFT_47689 [Pseudovirgaria hyperparasitica]|uniref:Uncharacterized protein n=1 Tax=Pseudovirgaria hyperparasitica TaxID=470096 RepID=A0A6A6W4F1_9PEZI|nr:uncharacterized protein EJ05DRAFT_47689 [Pseudovirgaria hyperparasitica]KAF2756914.1 hypothetical protein EJ05DRAFT_47689 [Pseudovirgaria hyperparasitica]
MISIIQNITWPAVTYTSSANARYKRVAWHCHCEDAHHVVFVLLFLSLSFSSVPFTPSFCLTLCSFTPPSHLFPIDRGILLILLRPLPLSLPCPSSDHECARVAIVRAVCNQLGHLPSTHAILAFPCLAQSGGDAVDAHTHAPTAALRQGFP